MKSQMSALKGKVKKIILSCLVFVLLTLSFVPYARAQEGTWYNQSFQEWSTKVFDSSGNEIFGERYTFAQVQWIVYSIGALLAGGDLLKCVGVASAEITEEFKSCIQNLGPSETGSATFKNPGLVVGLAYLGDIINSTKVASGAEYLTQTAYNLHLIPEAKAQQEGFGFKSLQPVQKIWRVFRNMAYSLLVVVVLIISFMIMFRVKISPQLVISIQSALPKIAITLILITFSYAIAGLIVDLSYLVIALIAAFVKSGGLAGNLTPSLSVLELAQKIWGGTASPIASLVILISIPIALLGFGGGAIAGAAGGSVTLPVIGTAAGAAGFGLLVGILVILLALFAIIIAIIRILWAMIKAFINVLLLIIFGPILLLFGAISPAAGGFGTWLKNLAANVAVFPTISIMIFLAHLLFWSGDVGLLNWLRESGFFNPFQIGPSLPPSAFSFPSFDVSAIVASTVAAFGILLITPSAADLIKSIIQGQPFNFGTAFGQATGALRLAGIPVGEATHGLGAGDTVAGIKLEGRPREVVGIISRAGESLGVFPKHR